MTTKDLKYRTRSMSLSVMSSNRPIREGNDFKKPNVCRRAGQFNVTHTLPDELSERGLDATFFTDYAAMLRRQAHFREAFVVFGWPKRMRTKQTISFWLEGSIKAHCFWFSQFFTERP